jgi:hypothetical protein
MTVMPERCRYAPDYALPPGETLVEVLAERGMSRAELARRAGLSAKHVNQIVFGTAALTGVHPGVVGAVGCGTTGESH